MTNNGKLPDGWQMTTLGKVCKFQYGASLPERSREPGLVEVYGSNGIVGQHSIALTDGPAIVIGRKGSIGQVHFSPQACWPIDTTYYVDRQNTQADLYWLSFILKSLRLDKLNKAAAVPGLNRTDAYQLPIPLPPLAEQRRIAAAIEERLCEVERARAAVQAQLDDAHALMAAHLRAVFESEEAQGWERQPLGEITRTTSGQTPLRSRSDFYDGGTICWVKTGELRDNTIYDTEEHITELALSETGLACLPPETVLVAMYGQGQTRGRTAILKVAAATNQACFAILPQPSVFVSEFVQFWFRYQYETLRQESDGRGGNQPNLNGKLLRAKRVALPSLERQTTIVNELRDIENSIVDAQGYLRNQLNDIDRLPAAILRQAFAGEL